MNVVQLFVAYSFLQSRLLLVCSPANAYGSYMYGESISHQELVQSQILFVGQEKRYLGQI